MPRKSRFALLLDHFHTHPQGRLHEMLFWNGAGLVLGALAFAGWKLGYINDAFGLLFGIVALCLAGFGWLPQRRPAPPPEKVGRLRPDPKPKKKKR